jgi:hypothetical protein
MGTFPLLALVGIGIAWSNSRAVWRGLTRWGGEFARTPKFRLEGRGGRWDDSGYRLRPDVSLVGEIVLGLYALVTAALAFKAGRYDVIPFALLYAAAFNTVAGMGLVQLVRPWLRRPVGPALVLEVAQRERRR